MGVQAVGAGEGGSETQQSPFAPLLFGQNSRYNLSLDEFELESQFGSQDKPLGSMNLDEFLKSMSSAEAAQPVGVGAGDGSFSSSLQKQVSLKRTSSKKTVDEVWKEIEQGGKAGNGVVVKSEKETMTLEDFLTKTGAYTEESSLSPAVELDTIGTPRSFSAQFSLSPVPSIGALSDSPGVGSKRDVSDSFDRSIDRKLKRKIKNRESAARSRARKQAYHNELVSKVSCLEMDNIKLKKEKQFEELFPDELSDAVKYQLRRTSSARF